MRTQEPITIYGVNHSPWVQSVCLYLEARGLPYTLISAPLGVSSFWHHGLVMPQCRLQDGSVVCGSNHIIAAVEMQYSTDRPLTPISDSDLAVLERFFLSFALSRIGNRKVFAFIIAWSKMRSDHMSLMAPTMRAFMCLYFLLLIAGGRRMARRRGYDPDGTKTFIRFLHDFRNRLGHSAYFGGERPSGFDFALLGLCQCICTGPTDAYMERLRDETELRGWLTRMQENVPAYRHDYISRLDDTQRFPESAEFFDRFGFWVGLLGIALSVPLTLLVFLIAFKGRSTNPNRSGGQLGT